MLLAGAMCVGLLINQLRDQRLPLIYASKDGFAEVTPKRVQGGYEMQSDAFRLSTLSESARPQDISFEDFRQHVAKNDCIILDARPEMFYRLRHVPGALSVPRKDFGAAYTILRPLLERDKAQPLLVYCSGVGCEDSQTVADALSKLGYLRVFVCKGGWAQWEAAHLPDEKSE